MPRFVMLPHKLTLSRQLSSHNYAVHVSLEKVSDDSTSNEAEKIDFFAVRFQDVGVLASNVKLITHWAFVSTKETKIIIIDKLFTATRPLRQHSINSIRIDIHEAVGTANSPNLKTLCCALHSPDLILSTTEIGPDAGTHNFNYYSTKCSPLDEDITCLCPLGHYVLLIYIIFLFCSIFR